jgi:hypothetical protein
MWPGLAWNSLHSPNWPQTPDSPACAPSTHHSAWLVACLSMGKEKDLGVLRRAGSLNSRPASFTSSLRGQAWLSLCVPLQEHHAASLALEQQRR